MDGQSGNYNGTGYGEGSDPDYLDGWSYWNPPGSQNNPLPGQGQGNQLLVPPVTDPNLNPNPPITPPVSGGNAGAGSGGGTGNAGTGTQIVPGQADPNDPNQINVVDYAGQVATDPNLAFGDDMKLGNSTPDIDPNTVGTGINQPSPMDPSGTNAGTATAGGANQASQVDPRDAVGYDAAQTQDNIAQNGQMDAAQGEVSDGAIITEDEVPQIDVDATARGDNELGKALLEHAEQDLNTVDPKATVKGQLEQLQADFTGPNGEPIVPIWAQGAARQISKIAAFKGMTGSAATAAMSNAIMEASLPVATADAQFFQTLTVQNLTNKQQSIINRANILSKFEEMNQDSRTAAAIQNAKHFMEMDLANLSNEQQAEIINTQARIQSILEDAKAENTARMFLAQSENDMGMFYDQLNSQIEQYNANQSNDMKKFNTDQINGMSQFNSNLENQREQFYKEMQFNVDVSNAKWRQEVTLQNNQNKFEAAAFDVRNLVDMSKEQLNQIWDRSDAMLDYVWKSSENEAGRQNAIILATIQAQSAADIQNMKAKAEGQAGIGAIVGTVAGSFAQNLFGSWFK